MKRKKKRKKKSPSLLFAPESGTIPPKYKVEIRQALWILPFPLFYSQLSTI